MNMLYTHHRPFPEFSFAPLQDHGLPSPWSSITETADVQWELAGLAQTFPVPCRPRYDLTSNHSQVKSGEEDRLPQRTHVRSRGIPTETWHKHRPIITELYLANELQDVMRIMKERLNFDAT